MSAVNRGTPESARSNRWALLRLQPHIGQAAGLDIPAEWLAGAAFGGLVSVTLFGPIGVLVFLGTLGLLVLSRPGETARNLLIFAPLLIIPIYACLSTFWSESPQRSLRAGLQLLLTFIAAIAIARNLRPERMILLLFAGYLAVCLSVVPGIPSSLATGQPLGSAILGSKNQVSFSAHLLGAAALAICVDRNQPALARLIAVGSVPLVAILAYLSQSGGGTTSFLITLTLFPMLAFAGRLKLTARLVLLGLALVLGALAMAFAADVAAAITDFRVNVLKKDATLTGRTYLWDFADRLAAQRPLLGHGYGAFWRIGNIDAEGLWRWGGIPNRSGFNFHNAFVSFRVDLGAVGEWLFILTCAAIALIGCYRLLMRPTVPIAFFVALLAVMYPRALVEEGLVAPFGVISLLWLATLVYAVEPDRRPVPAGGMAGSRSPVMPRRDSPRQQRGFIARSRRPIAD